MNAWMIYGAYGFTGKLIAEASIERGLPLILAGRDEVKGTAGKQPGFGIPQLQPRFTPYN